MVLSKSRRWLQSGFFLLVVAYFVPYVGGGPTPPRFLAFGGSTMFSYHVALALIRTITILGVAGVLVMRRSRRDVERGILIGIALEEILFLSRYVISDLVSVPLWIGIVGAAVLGITALREDSLPSSSDKKGDQPIHAAG